MTAGVEESQLGNAIDRKVNKDMHLDTCCRGTGKGTVVDDDKCKSPQANILEFKYMVTPILENGCMGHQKSDSLIPDSCSSGQLPPVSEYIPVIRSGVYSDQGLRTTMEDAHVCIDDLTVRFDDLTMRLGSMLLGNGQNSCYGIFDGHGGKDAAQFARDKLLNFIVQDLSFPSDIEDAVHRGFLNTDKAFEEACALDDHLYSGTTAIMALILGRRLLVANAGDCRAVLSRQGKAVDLSRDHKPSCLREKNRIESLGGYIDDGYLNGVLGVARALGDWHLEDLKGVGRPLTAEPEVKQVVLTNEDEFLIIGCDGLWDVFSSQLAVDFARRRLQQHNDPEQCCRDLVTEALRRESGDNLTVVMVCFQSNPPPKPKRFVVRKSISSQGLQNLQCVIDNLTTCTGIL